MSLAISYDEIRQEVGFTAGYGSDPSKWDGETARSVNAWIRGGLRRFLFGTPLGGKVYDWSFLRQRFDFTTVAEQGDYDLPADFGQPDGPLYFQGDQFTPVEFRNESYIEHLRSLNVESAGTPCYAATRYKGSGGTSSQRQELMLHPTPTGSDDLRLLYRINGEMLSSANQYPPGGPEHSRTVLFACLAELGRRRNLPEMALYEADYQAAFTASISKDNEVRGPMGMNRGDSEAMSFPRQLHGGTNWVVGYNGTVYDDT